MNRRQFLLVSTSFIALPTLAISCQDRLALLTSTLGNAVSTLAAAVGHTEWANKLRHDTDIVVGSIRAWREGQSAAQIIHQLNELIRDIKLLDALENFRPLITFALGTAASIIEFFAAKGGGEQPDTTVRLTKPPLDAHQFRVDWDSIRAGSPNMQQAPVL